MRKSIIPPRTMRDITRRQAAAMGNGPKQGIKSSMRAIPPPTESAESSYSTGLFRKPRNWRFQTKPLFKKLHGPLIDVFEEADEVLIVIDLSGFLPSEVSLQRMPDKYVISARHGSEEFQEEILLPPEVDVERCVEHFRNGILEITLPRQTKAEQPEGEP